MTKRSRKKNAKRYRHITDKAIIKFISNHSKKPTIDFSKMKITSFLDCLETKEEKKTCICDTKEFDDSNKQFDGEKKNLKALLLPKFKFSIIKDSTFGFINNNESKFKSFLFN